MKTNYKRIICAIFAFCILVCALSACGGGSSTDASSKGNTNSEGPGDVIAIEPESKEGYGADYNPYASIPAEIKGSTVRFATWIDHTQTEGAVPMSKFEADTGLKCALYTVPQWGYVKELMTKIDAGDIPDVFVSNEGDGNFPATVQLAAAINKVSTVDLQDPIWDQSMLATATFEGNTYLVNTIGSPWSGSNLVYYNKVLFEDNGFKTPAEYYEEGNWTWATMKKVMKDVKSLGSDYYGGYVDPEVLGDSAGASFIKFDYKTHTFINNSDDKNLLATYQWYADARDEGLLGGQFTHFKEGKCGIVITGVFGLKATGHWRDMDPNDVGFTYLPALEDGTEALTSSIYRMYGIIEGAPNANAAGYFLRHFLDPKNYDLNNTFLTIEAGNFYYSLINKTADQKYFNFDDTCGSLIGGGGSGVFTNGAKGAPSAQVNTKIQAVSNKVDEAVEKSQEIIDTLIEANK